MEGNHRIQQLGKYVAVGFLTGLVASRLMFKPF